MIDLLHAIGTGVNIANRFINMVEVNEKRREKEVRRERMTPYEKHVNTQKEFLKNSYR